MSTKPTELEVSYAILLKLAGSEKEAASLIEQAKELLKPESNSLPKLDPSKLSLGN